MSKSILAIVVTLVMLAVGSTGNACDFCLLSQGISPLDTMKGTGIKVSERYTVLDQVYHGTSEKTNPGAEETHWTTELTGFYGVTPDFMIMAVLPYKNGMTTGELMQNPDGTLSLDTGGSGRAAGIGDVALLGRYTFLKREGPDSTTVLAAVAGVKFETGNTSARARNGEFLDSHLQPGTGSTDYLLGLSYSHSLSRFSVSANLLGTIANEGKFGDTEHQFGNSVNYDVTAKYRVAPEAFTPTKPQVFVALGVTGEARGREKMDHATVQDSGGNTVYLSPGLQVVFAPHWVVELTYQRAVLHNLYGTQLGETYKAISGVTYLF